jgi:paraquat-inducible protein A
VKHTTACHECDLYLELPALREGEKALCPRCGHIITALSWNALNRVLAYALAALIFLVAANAFPFLAFRSQGQEQATTLLQSVTALYAEGYASLAVLILLCITLNPALLLIGVVYLCLPLKFGRCALGAFPICKWLFVLTPWSMVEVFLIGVLVSLIKIADMAQVILGISFWAYIAFSIVLTATLANLDRHQLWDWLEDAQG